MTEVHATGEVATFRAKNIGGISETEVGIPPGVTVLAGRNATNRTSFLRAIMAVTGSRNVSLKGDADEGSVELDLNGEAYSCTLSRTDGRVSMGGDPYLDDPTLADLFAFLLERNEARRAVARGEDLRELIMRPVDTEEIRTEINRLERERDAIDEQLAELDSLKDDLPSLEQRRTRLESKIEENRETLAEKEVELESMDADVGDTRGEKRELESRLEELRDLRSELEEVRADIELQEESVASLRGERADLREELEGLSGTPIGDRDHLDREVSRLRERKGALEARLSDLQDVIQFNEEMLSGEERTLDDVLKKDRSTSETVTDRLVADEQITCWTCGSEVERGRINETVDRLRSVRRDLTEDVREIEGELEEVRSVRRELEEQQRRRERVERKLADVEDELDRREERIAEFRERRDDFVEEIAAVEESVEDLESEHLSEVLGRHREANQLEFEIERLESDLDDVTDRIAMIEDQLADEDTLRERREGVAEDLSAQQMRIERTEREAVEEFNDRMAEVLEVLEYGNLARIWIERLKRTVRDGRERIEESAYELHVVRTTDSGEMYGDTIDHLSESEREVTGLVFALAGYLVHDVYETVPFMLLDSLEAIDSGRLADLVSYFSGFAEYLVVAVLPEDARALSDQHTVITDV